mgnify:CR=1
MAAPGYPEVAGEGEGQEEEEEFVSQLQKVLCTMALWLDPRSFVLIGFFSALTAKNFLWLT